MAHELEEFVTVDGKEFASFAFSGARENIWHRLGQNLGGKAMTTDEAMVAANMDRELQIIDLPLPEGTEWGIAPQKVVVLEGKMGITPEGDLFTIPNKIVGVHGEGGAAAHGALSMRDRFDYAELAQHVTRGEAVWSTAGMLRNGTQGFACMEVKPFVLDPDGVNDVVQQYLTVTWSFDGSRATELATSQIRVVCANTLAMHDQGKNKVVKVKHTSAAAKERLASVVQQIALHKDREAALKLKAEQMLRVPDGKGKLMRFVEQVVFPVADEPSKRATTIRDGKLLDVEALFYAATNSVAVGDNGWAAYNTLVEYFDWYSPVKGKGDDTAARLQNQFDGTYDAVKSQFADFLLAAV